MSFIRSLLQILIAVILAALAYYYAQRAVDMNRLADINRGSFRFEAYLECARKVATYDWSKFPGGKPGSTSEICGGD